MAADSMTEGQPGVAAIAKFFVALQARDVIALRASLAPSVRMLVPMNESGQADPPERQFFGIDETIRWYEGVMQRISSPLLFKNQETTISSDGTRVFVENVSDMRLPSGRCYRNVYVWRFDLFENRITEIRAYNNPVTAALAFGRILGPAGTSC